ncbi:MAG: OmpA family protein [Myxococcota bacterium]
MHTPSLALVALAGTLLALPSSSHAAPAGAEGKTDFELQLEADLEEGADADADADSDADAGPWILRHTPRKHMWEVGFFGGVWLPSDEIELRDRDLGPVSYDNGPALGLRAGYYPLRHLGFEGELTMMPTRLATQQRAFVSTARAQVIVQLGLYRIVPFVVIGGGAINVRSEDDAAGRNGDEMLHVGGGLKYFVNDHIVVRLEGRDIMSPKEGITPTGPAHSGEILLGFSLALGPRPPKEEPPPPDADGDGFTDDQDACPQDPGIAPDGCPAVDTDADGFLDDQDACPEQAGKAPDGCPIRDSDGDGFLDPDDACPDEVGVDPDGCPIRDHDGDGLLEPEDKCPMEAETANGFEDEDGCPDELPEEVKQYTGVVDGIVFATGKAKIRRLSFPKLDQAVKVLTDYPALRVEISGHTDNKGKRPKNLTLSQERADAVKNYLVEKGVDASRIETRGAGPDEPVGDNATKEGRQQNRRIEFKLLTSTPAAKAEPAAAAKPAATAEPAAAAPAN